MNSTLKKMIAPIAIGIAGAAVLASLGIWQLQRLEWKEALIAQRQTELDGQGINFAQYLSEGVGNAEVTPFTDSGTFLDGATDILGGGRDGAGYRRIITAEIDGTKILVEAGFLPESQKNADYALPRGEYKIVGHIFQSQGRIGTYDTHRDVWVGYDIPKMAEQLGTIPLLIVLRESPLPEWQSTPVTVSLPNSHLGYAIQWFALALVWLAMAFYWGYTRAKKVN